MTHRHVLIVDDDEDTRSSLAVLLEIYGFDVRLAENGAAALARLRCEPPPCLVVLDLMMPEMNGWELRSRMLADPELAQLKVLVVSGVADLDDKARRLGAVDYLAKPVDFERLLAAVRANC